MYQETGTNGIDGTRFSYDSMGKVTSTQTLPYGASSWTPGMGAQYDLAGNITQLTYPNGRIVGQSWDGAGRLSSVSDITAGSPGTPLVGSLGYTPSGAEQSFLLGNGVGQFSSFNSRQQPCHTMASSPALGGSSVSTVLAGMASSGNLLDRADYYHSSATANCGSESGDNGNIYSIVDNLQVGKTQSFSYDSLNRLTSGSSSDGAYNHTYNYDSFGNMVPTNNLISNNPDMEQDPSGTNRLLRYVYGQPIPNQYDAAGYLRYTGTSDIGGHSFMYTAEGYLRSIDAYTVGSYVYNGLGERILAVRNNSTWTEYTYFNGQPMAEVTDQGVWTDYIYANGHKIAKMDSQKPFLHTHGDRSAPGVNLGCGVGWYVALGNGIQIGSGDKFAFDQLQIGSHLGMAVSFYGTRTQAVLEVDGQGQPLYESTDDTGTWRHRIFDFSDVAGNTIAYMAVGTSSDTPAVVWDTYYANMAIVHADGSVSPAFTGQAVVSEMWSTCGSVGQNLSVDLTPTSDPATNTTYYLDDHLGTTQVELSSGGWPLWEGQFTPFGQEIVNGTPLLPNTPDGASMHYKFTGKERDTESGLDYFGARYYASNMGRWMSPDWSATAVPVPYAKLDNPQSLNLYAYVGNNPLAAADPDGHETPHDKGLFDGPFGDPFTDAYAEMDKQDANRKAAQQQTGRQPDGSYIAPTGPGSEVYNRTHGGRDGQVLHPPDDTEGQCVTACKHFSGITASTKVWKEGAAASGNSSLPIGTAIATFGSNGKYPTNGDQNSGIYMGQGSKPGSILILDQWPAYGPPTNTPAHPPSIREMFFNSDYGHSMANSASAYHVIIVP